MDTKKKFRRYDSNQESADSRVSNSISTYKNKAQVWNVESETTVKPNTIAD